MSEGANQGVLGDVLTARIIPNLCQSTTGCEFINILLIVMLHPILRASSA